ncbi:hypothetical protein HKX48_008463 [Thoreauomyces humboldtii]|nr:hypothetical protein HKX48_008463 [Thoreauomyces humboldtii]
MLSAESSTPKPDEKEQVAPVDKAAPSSQDHSNTNTNTNTGTNTADQIDAGTANTGAATSYPTSKQDVPCKEDDKDQTSGTQDEQEQDITSPQACTSSSGCFPATSSGQKDGHDDWTHVRVQTASGQFDTDGRRVIAIAVDESGETIEGGEAYLAVE